MSAPGPEKPVNIAIVRKPDRRQPANTSSHRWSDAAGTSKGRL